MKNTMQKKSVVGELIDAIAENGDTKIMKLFLIFQDEQIKFKERIIEGMDKILKTSSKK